jgi:predicted nucleotidyltransferase component of viral defense system
MSKLHYETVTPILREILAELMAEPLLAPFALAGGTSLSLRYGHRVSVDIDLFTNAEYGSLDFSKIEELLKSKYHYYLCMDSTEIVGFGRTYYIGRSEADSVKVDMFYHDDIADPYEVIDGIRLVTVQDVAAMKIDVVSRGGRKKDFWDLDMLLEHFSIMDMIGFRMARHFWEEDYRAVIDKLADFSLADEFPDPECLLNKDWGLIKLRFTELAESL